MIARDAPDGGMRQRALADEVVVMQSGKVVEQASTDEVSACRWHPDG